ncbi:MAG: GDSL-type esterase/lipase family protein [Paludibacter sp.]|nr:GDSL-type esterase/lipase family protein [Paludibacter sp.]
MRKIIFKAVCFSMFLLLVLTKAEAKKTTSEFNIVFIGNSITQGAGLQNRVEQAPPVMAVKYLREHQCRVKFANCGVSGSTTVNFLPASNSLFPRVVKAADTLYSKGTPLVFSMILGTNDSAIKGPTGAPVSPENYKKNLLTIIDSLLQRYPKSHIILHQPIWYSPNTHNSATYLSEGLARLQSYTPQILSIPGIRPGKVFIGDRKACKFFEKNHLQYLAPEKGNSGTFYLHPNAAGAKILGEMWADVIMKHMRKADFKK